MTDTLVLPPVSIDTITTSNWQLSNVAFGQIAQGADDILMCIHNILFTMKGEVPFNPFFGSNLFKLIDRPITIVGPEMVSEIIDAINKWEPRVAVNSCTWSLAGDYGQVVFQINMTVISSSSPLGYSLTLNNSKDNRRAFSDGFTTTAFG